MRPLVILSGATAVGKTGLSVELAKRIGAEIISADSLQVYRHLDIGSAKIRPEEMQGVPHHLIDCFDPDFDFNVTVFQREAKKAVEDIHRRGKIPLITGGTGFYIQSVLYDIDFNETASDPAYRRELAEYAAKEGAAALHERLSEVDPEAAEMIHENNLHRVIRALEFYRTAGEPISEHNRREARKTSPYDFAYFVLDRSREALYAEIDHRVDRMMEEGLLDEVRKLKEMGCTPEMTSMQGLGYRELLGFLNGETDLPEAVRLIKQNTRHYAKRQLTWFRREKDVIWLSAEGRTREELIADIQKRLMIKGILV